MIERALSERIIRLMAKHLRSLQIDLDDEKLCFVALWERGWRDNALRECMDAARTMARIRQTNDERHAS